MSTEHDNPPTSYTDHSPPIKKKEEFVVLPYMLLARDK